MPIKAENKNLYPRPAEWRAIRERILARSNNACECLGECGTAHDGIRCSAPNSKMILRTKHGERPDGKPGTVSWYVHDGCSLCLGGDDECRPILVVLTTAHLDHNPGNNDDANLRAFCQLCHLRYDRHEHARNAAATRAATRDAMTGQKGLF